MFYHIRQWLRCVALRNPDIDATFNNGVGMTLAVLLAASFVALGVLLILAIFAP